MRPHGFTCDQNIILRNSVACRQETERGHDRRSRRRIIRIMDFGHDDDDLFASLGGSLMKNLLADLNGDTGTGGLLSLEELEQELAHLDDRTPLDVPPSPGIQAPNTAASMVVRAQEQVQSTKTDQQDINAATSAPLDAWSLSLEKFTAASLQDDFLQADSARKAKTSGQESANSNLQQQSLVFRNAEEYDVSEPLLVSPPPGIAAGNSDGASRNLAEELTTKLETVSVVDQTSAPTLTDPPEIPEPRKLPKTPPNSMTFSLPRPPPPTPQNSVVVDLASSSVNAGPFENIPTIHEDPVQITVGNPPNVTPGEEDSLQKQPPLVDPTTSMPSQKAETQPAATATAASNVVKPGQPAPQHESGSRMQSGAAAPSTGPSVQPSQILALPPRTTVYCNPTPGAMPIPATAIASKFMSARDISYVVHAILKPILNSQQYNTVSPFDYDRAFWQKTIGGPSPASDHPTAERQHRPAPSRNQGKSLQDEIESRDQKAKNWSTENSVLGRTAKSQVTRPRSLIAQPIKQEQDKASSKSTEQRRRQALWKARIYCDQAYQAYINVVHNWHVSVSPNQGMTPAAAANLQPHLFKLLRCLGLSRSDQTQGLDWSSELMQEQQQQSSYSMTNETALPLLTKLPKGRVLLARVLEQALLPPPAVSVLLPFLFKAMYVLPSSTISSDQSEDTANSITQELANDRVFTALSRVLQTLPNIPKTEIIRSLDVVQEHSAVALQSPVRMQAVHSLLQRGTQLSASDPSLTEDWKKREEAFLQVLSG